MQAFAAVVYLIFVMVMNLLLLNIIIAMFSKTFEDITSNSESEWMLQVRRWKANYE